MHDKQCISPRERDMLLPGRLLRFHVQTCCRQRHRLTSSYNYKCIPPAGSALALSAMSSNHTHMQQVTCSTQTHMGSCVCSAAPCKPPAAAAATAGRPPPRGCPPCAAASTSGLKYTPTFIREAAPSAAASTASLQYIASLDQCLLSAPSSTQQHTAASSCAPTTC